MQHWSMRPCPTWFWCYWLAVVTDCPLLVIMHVQAKELEADLRLRRAKSVSHMIGRVQLNPEEADRLLAGTAAVSKGPHVLALHTRVLCPLQFKGTVCRYEMTHVLACLTLAHVLMLGQATGTQIEYHRPGSSALSINRTDSVCLLSQCVPSA